MAFSNADLAKINSLFDKGILDEAGYLKSIKELGVNTTTEEFSDILKLYKKKLLILILLIQLFLKLDHQ